jgi:hypothetical protein
MPSIQQFCQDVYQYILAVPAVDNDVVLLQKLFTQYHDTYWYQVLCTDIETWGRNYLPSGGFRHLSNVNELNYHSFVQYIGDRMIENSALVAGRHGQFMEE